MKNIHYGKSAAPASKVSKTRRCTECKRVYATPEAFRMHKLAGVGCRPIEALRAIGYVETDKGWRHR
jgi:hypothetical protein